MTQNNSEHPRPTLLAIGTDHRCAGSKINLSFFTRIRFHPAKWDRGCLSQPHDETPHAVITSLEAVVRPQVLVDSLNRETLIQL